jgi:hypothetical protein
MDRTDEFGNWTLAYQFFEHGGGAKKAPLLLKSKT